MQCCLSVPLRQTMLDTKQCCIRYQTMLYAVCICPGGQRDSTLLYLCICSMHMLRATELGNNKKSASCAPLLHTHAHTRTLSHAQTFSLSLFLSHTHTNSQIMRNNARLAIGTFCVMDTKARLHTEFSDGDHKMLAVMAQAIMSAIQTTSRPSASGPLASPWQDGGIMQRSMCVWVVGGVCGRKLA